MIETSKTSKAVAGLVIEFGIDVVGDLDEVVEFSRVLQSLLGANTLGTNDQKAEALVRGMEQALSSLAPENLAEITIEVHKTHGRVWANFDMEDDNAE